MSSALHHHLFFRNIKENEPGQHVEYFNVQDKQMNSARIKTQSCKGKDLSLRIITPFITCQVLTQHYLSPLPSSSCPSSPSPPAGDGVTCCRAHPPSDHLVCDTHKVMQDGHAVRDYVAVDGYFNGWTHYLV